MSQWTLAHLEMASTEQFPHGSASRAYILRLPLHADGSIDEQALATAPEMATVRRFWPNEPDRRGRLVRYRNGWVLAFGPADGPHNAGCTMDAQPIRFGVRIVLTLPDGQRLPFRIVRLQPEG